MQRRPAQAPCEVRFPHRPPCGRGQPPAGQLNTFFQQILSHAGEGMAPGTYVGIVHRLRHLVPNQERRVRFPLPAPIVSSHHFTARRECRRATSPHSPDGRALDLGSRGRRFEPGCGDQRLPGESGNMRRTRSRSRGRGLARSHGLGGATPPLRYNAEK